MERGRPLPPGVEFSLPHVRTKLGTVLEDFTLSLVRVHTFCRAEFEEERNTTKALSARRYLVSCFFASAFCCSYLLLKPLCILIFTKTLRRSCPGIPGGAIRGWASSSWSVQNADISI
jgi:hypothetical protein